MANLSCRHRERRERNAAAAKRSRKLKKIKEDEIAVKSAYLEEENRVLRAQNLTLRNAMEDLKRGVHVDKENSAPTNAQGELRRENMALRKTIEDLKKLLLGLGGNEHLAHVQPSAPEAEPQISGFYEDFQQE